MRFLRGHNNICRLYEIGIAKSSNYMIAKRLRIWSSFIFIDPCKIGKIDKKCSLKYKFLTTKNVLSTVLGRYILRCLSLKLWEVALWRNHHADLKKHWVLREYPQAWRWRCGSVDWSSPVVGPFLQSKRLQVSWVNHHKYGNHNYCWPICPLPEQKTILE